MDGWRGLGKIWEIKSGGGCGGPCVFWSPNLTNAGNGTRFIHCQIR